MKIVILSNTFPFLFFLCHISQTVRHGFPYQPSSMAFDPVQKILAIGTQSGALRLYPFQLQLRWLIFFFRLLWPVADSVRTCVPGRQQVSEPMSELTESDPLVAFQGIFRAS